MSLSTAFDVPKRSGSSPVLLSKTCQNCFSLKIRCDRTQRTDICDRCARLGKQCAFRPARRRDNSAKRDSRIQALEAQVQQLLSTREPLPPIPQAISTSASPSSSNPQANPSVASPHPSSPRSEHGDGDVVDADIITTERADTLVEMYKSDMMPHFPFVIIPPHVTASQLRHEKPFLFLALLSVACFHDLPVQDRLGDRFKYMVSDRVLLGGDDCLSLGYIQGLLVVLAWNQYHHRSRFFSQYIALAISVAVDMRLDRRKLRSKVTSDGRKRDVLALDHATQSWGSEEQRATAGLFYLSSTVSKLLDKLNVFPWSQHIEAGCLALREKAQYKTDKDLYHVIQLQRIIDGIESLSAPTSSEDEAHAAYLRTRAELEQFRAYLVTDVSDSHLLFMQFHTAKLFLYQVAFFERSLQQHPSLNISILCEGLESAKSFLDLYLWLPPKSEMALTNCEWVQLSFGVTLAAKFAIISREPSCEAQTRELRNRLNLENVFRHLALRIGALVGRDTGGQKERDIFIYYEARVRKIQTWYDRMVRATSGDRVPHTSTNNPGNQVSLPQLPPPPSMMGPGSNSTKSTPPSTSGYSLSVSPQPHSSNPRYTPAPAPSSSPLPVNPLPTTYATFGTSPSSSSVMSGGMNTNASYAIPQIAFGDLMAAPGWDMPFVVPMEQDPWAWDLDIPVPQAQDQYQGYDLGSGGLGSGSLGSERNQWGS